MRDDARVDLIEEEFVDCPTGGRRVVRSRAVRLGDVTTSGRLRLDALARYLQDVAADDSTEVGVGGTWVLRRVALRFDGLPRYRDVAELATFCSGAGPRWAERRTTVRVGGQTAAEAAAVWVSVDDAGRPVPLEPWFHSVYGSAAGGRRVSGRLRLPPPPASASERPWSLRAADFDALGHVNNAVAWAVVEDVLAYRAPDERVIGATLEYRAPIDPGDVPQLVTEAVPGRISCWLRCGGEVRTSAAVHLANGVDARLGGDAR